MNSSVLGFLLIALNFVSNSAKLFDQCEFAQELFEKHLVPREDIYKHFCIASSLHTANEFSGFKGIYGIGSQWWCGMDEVGGNCNVKCSDLLDDDIEDDVKCASLILSQQGLHGWSKTEEVCQRSYGKKTEDCLTEVEIFSGLSEALNSSDSTAGFSSERPTTTTSTLRTTPSSRRTEFSTSTDGSTIDANNQKLHHSQECSCSAQNTLLILIALTLCGLAAFLFVKNRNLKHSMSSARLEYENHLIS